MHQLGMRHTEWTKKSSKNNLIFQSWFSLVKVCVIYTVLNRDIVLSERRDHSFVIILLLSITSKLVRQTITLFNKKVIQSCSIIQNHFFSFSNKREIQICRHDILKRCRIYDAHHHHHRHYNMFNLLTSSFDWVYIY